MPLTGAQRERRIADVLSPQSMEGVDCGNRHQNVTHKIATVKMAGILTLGLSSTQKMSSLHPLYPDQLVQANYVLELRAQIS